MIKLVYFLTIFLLLNTRLAAEDLAQTFRALIPKFTYQQVLINLDYQFNFFGELNQTSLDFKTETNQNGKLEKIILSYNGAPCWIIEARDLLVKKVIFQREHLILPKDLSKIENKLITMMLNLIEKEIASMEAMPGFNLREGGDLRITLPRDIRSTKKEMFEIMINLNTEVNYSVNFPSPLMEDDSIEIVYWKAFNSVDNPFNKIILEPNYVHVDFGISKLTFPSGLSRVDYIEDQKWHQRQRWSLQAQTIQHIRKANGLQTKWRKL